MNYLSKCICFLFIITSATSLFAQKRKDIKDSSTVIIFNNNTQTKSVKKKKQASTKNIIKIAPLGLFSGTFPVFFEKKIKDFFSIQIAGGITRHNYVRNLIQKENQELNGNYSWTEDKESISEEPYSFNYRSANIGGMFSVQPRFYFDDEAPDGQFIALSFDTYKYNFSIPSIVGTADSYKQNGNSQSEFDKITDFMVHFGSQYVKERLTIEYSTAIGIRSVKASRYAATPNYTNNKIEQGTFSFKQTLFNCNIGLKIGYHF